MLKGRCGKLGLGDFEDRWEFEKIVFEKGDSDKAAAAAGGRLEGGNDSSLKEKRVFFPLEG
mgnify:CR=1 FL=1